MNHYFWGAQVDKNQKLVLCSSISISQSIFNRFTLLYILFQRTVTVSFSPSSSTYDAVSQITYEPIIYMLFLGGVPCSNHIQNDASSVATFILLSFVHRPELTDRNSNSENPKLVRESTNRQPLIARWVQRGGEGVSKYCLLRAVQCLS